MDWDQLSDKLSLASDRFGRSLKRVFGSRNERVVRQIEPLVAEINRLESWAKGLEKAEFLEQTKLLMKAVQEDGEDLDSVLPKAFALAREASVRTLGMRPFDVQLVGGIILHRGCIAEMMTGEGKTLVATLPLYLNALSGKSCYLVTVNDYLARRDAAWMAPVYRYLGLEVGAIQSNMDPSTRRPIYECEIVYGTNSEFGFDYLRDNMKTRVEDQVQRHLYFAIVDEVDSILIDEARTPLIISGPAEEGSGKYQLADQIARALTKDEHYEVKEKERSASLIEAGIEIAEKMVGVDSFYTPGNEDWPHFIENAIRAHELYRIDEQYVVEVSQDPRSSGSGPEVIIVDEFTGRKMPGRRWSDGLHQAVEVKEGLNPRQENQTLATITYQNYFRMFDKLAGMTGTALTEAGEFHKIYHLDTLAVPTNLPVARDDQNDVVYRTEQEKWKAICDEIVETHGRGQPVLVGTTSIEKSELLAGLLKRRGIPFEVLNAKNHEREAHIVARAGEHGAVTVATNMAGRGTDIKLGGNFEYRLNEELKKAGIEPGDLERLEEIDVIRERVREQCTNDEQEVVALGGLYVLGTERHEARRIDNQLRGRSGRQGNAGRSRFFLSLQDPLMRIFYRDWVTNFMERLGMTEGQEIESKMVSRAIARAQKKVEDRNFEIRKNLLEYDEVMDSQRKEIYSTRQEVLEGRDLKEKVFLMFVRVIERACDTYHDDAEGFQGWFLRTFGSEIDAPLAEKSVAKDGDPQDVLDLLEKRYEEREQAITGDMMRKIERYILLNALDGKWKDHLHAMDSLKAGIGLRGYGQTDPKIEYKKEGYKLFEKLFEAIEDEVAMLILRIRLASEDAPPAPPAGSADGPAGAADGDSLQPRGMMRGAAPQGQRIRRPAAASSIPASQAFDLMRRRQAMARAMEAQRQAAAGASAEAPAAPASDPGSAGTATAEASPGQREQAPGAASERSPERPAEPPLTERGTRPVEERPSSGADDLPKVGRNDPCPCGSGAKFKKCHGR